MSHPRRIWLPIEDAKIRYLREQGETWETIAAAIGVAIHTLLDRAHELGVRHMVTARLRAEPARAADDHHRQPLPPGHAVTWGAITADTVLAGEPYDWRSPLARDAARRQGAFA